MRIRQIIAVLLLLLASFVGLLIIAPRLTDYSRFRHKSDDYYAELTKACDAMLFEHPLGTNSFVEISINDPKLPRIIRDLQPNKITVQPRRVWILHGGSIRFGIVWEQDESRTNLWELNTACESDVRVVYVAKR
jgi:hypothetical protein